MPTPQNTIKKILARRVIHRGREYGLSLVEINGCDVKVSPFEAETASTVYYNGTLRILCDGDKPLLIEE
ncbi:MAG: hypothetical protein K2M00_03340 [Muribaculaceae bacterium]|nr:hypothetical protein [Muribaculaceae bacterium]